MKEVMKVSERFRVVSDALEDIEYNYEYNSLRVRFTSGSRYRYRNVPLRIWNGLVKASSKGTFFNEHILDNYKFQRII